MTTLRTLVVTTGIFLAISAFGQVDAAPIQWTSGSGGNDHYYELILVTDPYNGNNNSWATASASASASVFNGLQGHLAVVTSQAENDFLQSLIPGGDQNQVRPLVTPTSAEESRTMQESST